MRVAKDMILFTKWYVDTTSLAAFDFFSLLQQANDDLSTLVTVLSRS